MDAAGLDSATYVTDGGVRVARTVADVPVEGAIEPLVDALDARRGVLLASTFEYPGRYTRWDIGFVDPPLELTARGRRFAVRALNDRGVVLLPAIADRVEPLDAVASSHRGERELTGVVREPEGRFAEEERSRQPSIFSVVRAIRELFASAEDGHLGLYGALGYDLTFQFEPIDLRIPRPGDQRDLVLFVPDDLLIVDHAAGAARRCRYEFAVGAASTEGIARDAAAAAFAGREDVERPRDHLPGQFAELVEVARERFRRGDLFEVVCGQTFYEPCTVPPSELFRRLRERNPAPYGSLMNLGEDEYLVGASPEMFVRVEGSRVETCPISGTVERGGDALGDADAIVELLSSKKEESELTMCTDVDRNDKARVCVPGSVRIIGRRQIEVYSRVIHTVDHVVGTLRPELDALDAFLTHTWAVTVTGAPKLWAMRFIEEHERSPRAWYGGAIGRIGFNGDMNTGLTLRTIRVKDGVAEVRAGATLLIDSTPADEERETELKASALLDALRRGDGEADPGAPDARRPVRTPARVLLLDFEDSFVHTLADYLRQTGAEVLTVRAAGAGDALAAEMDAFAPTLVVLSPGPGRPSDFDVARSIELALERGAGVFGVCLGLQGVVEHFGGDLGVLAYPQHGKPSAITVTGGRLLRGLPERFEAGLYHSLHAVRDAVPDVLEVTATSDDGVVMAVEHRELPVAAVQFHPESLMSLKGDVGLRLIENVLATLTAERPLPA